MVSSMEKSLEFYTTGLGFEIEMLWPADGQIRWCQLSRDQGTLMLQEGDRKIDKDSQGISIYFICDDALSIYEELIDKGVEVREPFVGNSMWVTTTWDPDGYEINFESETDVAEETTLTQWKE